MKPDHPWQRKERYLLEHVAVMETMIGRKLDPDEVVHHRDLNKQNNALENLAIKNRGEHTRLHHALRRMAA